MAEAKPKNPKRNAFTKALCERLNGMGLKPGSYVLEPRTLLLVVLVNGTLRSLPLKANMSRLSFERAMGRVEGWSDCMVTA